MAPVSAAEGGGLPIRCHFQIVFFLSYLGWKVQMLLIFRLLRGTWFSQPYLSLFFFPGVDFKMKTLLIDGIKVRIQIW